jgi:hypothetical protein
VQFGYELNYLIDIEHAIIVDIEPTSAGTYDQVAAATTRSIDAFSSNGRSRDGRLNIACEAATSPTSAWCVRAY